MNCKRILLGIATLLLAGASLAATVAERSPFTQGLWWERARSGTGFEMFNAGGQVMVIWYTFDAAGRPTWYTAQGAESALGQAWPLMKHRWSNGVKSEPAVAGSLALTVADSESAQVAWQVGPQSGVTKIEPFVLSGVVNEVDRSGTWFDPAQSGWGLTLLEQGDITGAALFTYTVDGEPTWAAGFERGKGSVELFASSGACPWCVYRAPNTVSAGRLNFDFAAESALKLANRTALPMAPGLATDGARMTQLGRPASMRAADRQLAGFDEASLRAYLSAGLNNLRVYSYGDFSASLPAPAFSPTNVQVEGVDEASLVKTNGTHVYTYAYDANGYQRVPELRVARIEADGARAKAVGSVSIGTGSRTPLGMAGLYLYGDSLVSVHGSQSYGGGWSSGTHWSQGLTQVEILDISTPDLPLSKWRADIDGYIVASRRVGATLYLVTRFSPYVSGFFYNPYTETQRAANAQLLALLPTDALLPKARTTDSIELRTLLAASDVHSAPQGVRKPMADMIVVTAIDLEARRIVKSLGILGYVDAVYASTGNLVLASSRYDSPASFTTLFPEPALYRTDLHMIRLGAGAMSIVGTGSVEGYLNAQPEKAPLRMDEHAGKLRVVTTSMKSWVGNSNRLTVLEPSPTAAGLLRTVSWLPNAQRPQPLGKPGETLYATRFMGERLYAVTFKKVDPLYVVDLADAADPVIAGALEIPGFSEYLHPLPNGLLLGFGKDTVPALDFGDGGQFAWYQGLAISLYDVRDAGKPRELQRMVMGKRGSGSALLNTHLAFSALQLDPGRLALGIPGRIHDGFSDGNGPSSFYPWNHSGLMRFEVQGTTAADAKIVQMKTLQSHNLQTVPPFVDPAISDARSVLFPQGSLYIGNGRFWHMDAAGMPTGPF